MTAARPQVLIGAPTWGERRVVGFSGVGVARQVPEQRGPLPEMGRIEAGVTLVECGAQPARGPISVVVKEVWGIERSLYPAWLVSLALGNMVAWRCPTG